MTTLRKHILTALDHAGDVEGLGTRAVIYSNLISALAIINTAKREHEHTPEPDGHRGDYRVVYDPESS